MCKQFDLFSNFKVIECHVITGPWVSAPEKRSSFVSKLYLFYGKNIVGNFVSNLVAYLARKHEQPSLFLCVFVSH